MTSHTRSVRPRVLALTTAACSAIVVLGGSAGTSHAASISTWEKVAQCESTSDWSYNRPGWPYYGGLQFSLSTWQAFGGTTYAARADLATKKQQILIAEKVLKSQGQGAWPNCGPAADLGADHADPYPEDSLPAPVNSQTTGADFNGDGQADIVARDASGTLKMWTHNAGGYFNAPVTVTGGWNFTQTAAADFDGDGKTDLIARDPSANLKIWKGRGDGTFGAAVNVTGGWEFTQTAAADFDGDGKADLIARDSSANLKIGKADLIARNDNNGELNIWAGRGDTTFGTATKLTGGW